MEKTKAKKKRSKSLPRPLFRRQIIQGKGGQLVKIIEPIGYRDFQTKFKRLLKDPRYIALRREFPNATYSIFGHPGHHKMPSLEAMLAFFETVYAPTVKAINGPRNRRSEFFGNLIIYAVKRGYRPSPSGKSRGRKQKARRGL